MSLAHARTCLHRAFLSKYLSSEPLLLLLATPRLGYPCLYVCRMCACCCDASFPPTFVYINNNALPSELIVNDFLFMSAVGSRQAFHSVMSIGIPDDNHSKFGCMAWYKWMAHVKFSLSRHFPFLYWLFCLMELSGIQSHTQSQVCQARTHESNGALHEVKLDQREQHFLSCTKLLITEENAEKNKQKRAGNQKKGRCWWKITNKWDGIEFCKHYFGLDEILRFFVVVAWNETKTSPNM